MVNSEELAGTAVYLTLQTGCRINHCRYNRVECGGTKIVKVIQANFSLKNKCKQKNQAEKTVLSSAAPVEKALYV